MLSFTVSGCWKDGLGGTRRINPDPDSEYPFQVYDNKCGIWYSSAGVGPRPHVPCEDPSFPEWRQGVAVYKWMLENPLARVENEKGVTYFLAAEIEASSSVVIPYKARPVRGYW